MPMTNSGYTVDLVVPCYNEEAIIEHSVFVIQEKMSSYVEDEKISTDSRR